MKKQTRSSFAIALVGAACWWPCAAWSVAPTEFEIGEAARWAAAKFKAVADTVKPAPGLYVLANNDPVQLNARNGHPMRLVNQSYARGLYCHATSKVIVRLPGGGAEFMAIVGVDSNDNTSGGRGSVRFTVQVNGREAFKTPVLREGAAVVPVKVALDGATEFTLQVDDGGDGISCDQADWADARVKLADGRELWLADLPLVEGPGRKPLSTEPPFTFTYDGKPSTDLLKNWKLTRSSRDVDAQRIEHTLTYADEATGLQVRCVAIEYRDFPTVEWTVYFKNTSQSDTPVLADIKAIDTGMESGGKGEVILHHHKGTFVRPDDFEPLTTRLKPNQRESFAPPGGRPCGHVWPYFNLEWAGQGAIVVVGWPGQWSAAFARNSEGGLRVTAGQERTRLRLKPGEEIRTPLMVLQFYRGDWLRAQNIWRRWMVAHNLPRPGGQTPRPLLTPCSSHQYAEMIQADEASQKFFIDRYLEEKLNPDYWWMDAGWYVNKSGWPHTGTWLVDSNRFPRGLRAITDHGRSKGVKSIVWFEPERVTPDTFLYTNNPAWLLGRGNGQKLLNLGHPEALAWLINHIDRTITEQGIDLYRQDYNVDPLGYWRETDTEDRQGITENHYVTGYLAYWDALRSRHPGMLIDSCASGGHRNDLETMRRSLPFLRSDCIMDAVANQGHTYGLAFWLPYHGTGSRQTDLYSMRSAMDCPHFIACWDMRDRKLDYNLLRKVVNDWRKYSDNYLGDYYPLTSYTTANDAWMGWQFDQPEQGRGVLQAFRRGNSIYEAASFKPRGLEPGARYVVTNLDSGETQTLAGRELMEKGLSVAIKDQPGDAVIIYVRE